MKLSWLEQLVFDESVRILIKDHDYTRRKAVAFMKENTSHIVEALQVNLDKNKRLAKKVLN